MVEHLHRLVVDFLVVIAVRDRKLQLLVVGCVKVDVALVYFREDHDGIVDAELGV